MPIMNRNDKNRKYTPLNINNVFKGKTVEPNNRPSYKLSGMQNIGKVSSMRRVPPPKWVPSLKAETGISDGRQIINQSSSGWVNPTSSADNGDSNAMRSQGGTNKVALDKSQWTSKLTTNKPFFLIGQEFPSLHSEGGHELSQESNITKEISKMKDLDTNKSKIDDLRNRDANISVSTLNRIDALSISKSSKGDIAAIGWAAEDEEPNFDEKIIFSDDESSNEIQNWHSDNDEASKSERCDKRDPIDIPPIISDVWHEPNQPMRFAQFQQMQLPVNVQGQFLTNNPFVQNPTGRNIHNTMASINDGQDAFMNSVAEQRNARNIEYINAIERARQKKFATQSSRGSCGMSEEQNQLDQALMRSRHTSMTSDTTESMNTPIEMGPPGGPPMLHHMHKPHLQPQISPMMHPHNMPVIAPSMGAQSMIRFAQHPYGLVPIPTVPMDHVDPKLMEKFVEFLKLQSNNDTNPDNSNSTVVMDQTQCTLVQENDNKNVPDVPMEQERPQSHVSSMSHSNTEKEHTNTIEKVPGNNNVAKDNNENSERDSARKTKSNFDHEDDNYKYGDQSKKTNKTKPYKEYRPNKPAYKGDYGANVGGDQDYRSGYYPENNDDMAYEDYNTYKQHYSRDYKNSRGYNRNPAYNNYYSSEAYPTQSRDSFSHDYHYKSNSLKLKSSKSKDTIKVSGASTEFCEPPLLPYEKYPSDGQEVWSHDADITDTSSNKKQPRDNKRNPPKSNKPVTSTYQPKKYDNRNYKDKSGDAPQEYSMGFAVNPKDSRKNYYSSGYNRRYYPEYSYYSNSKYAGGEYDENYHYQDTSYYSQDNYYNDVSNYSSGKSSQGAAKQRIVKNSSSSEQWRVSKDDRLANSTSNSGNQSKVPTSATTGGGGGGGNRSSNNQQQQQQRKSDKRQFSMSKDNDNDQDEWETASEGGSVRSNSAPRDVHKMHGRQANSQSNQPDNGKMAPGGSSSETRKPPMNKSGSNYSCNGGNNSFNDNNGNQDGNGGASGSAGGARFLSNNRSNVSQSRSVDSSQNKNMDKTSNSDNRNSDSTSKHCSNNNNSNKDGTNTESRQTESSNKASIDLTNASSVITMDKFSDIIEDDEFIYETTEFQVVLSKATKKSRKLEEQKRLKEELKLEQKRLEEEMRLEQKRLDSIKFKSKNENNSTRKSVTRRDPIQRPNKCEPSATVHKYENKAVSNIREKEQVSNNTFKPKWETNKDSMQIGSWDNSLADEISSEKKAPPKPIGTPASADPWNKKVKGPFEKKATINVCQHPLPNDSVKLPTDIETISQPFIVSSESSDGNFNTTMSYSYNNSIYNNTARTSEENKIETQTTEIAIHDTINFEYDVKNINCDKNHRNSLSTDRNLQSNDQKLLNDKINSVKTIWDNQPVSSIAVESKVTTSSSINQDLDIHAVVVSINQDASNTRNIDNSLVSPSVPIPNVCKVKPQLQQDFKKDHNEYIITSQGFPFRNSPATFLSQNQGSFMPYHRFPEFISDPIHASDAFASIISNNQQGMHLNYNLPNTHLIDSSMLRQNPQEQMLSNKMNFINQSQSSFYPQQATTPKLMSNNPAQLPINMDMSSAHGPPHMQQLLLTRQNSLTSMMQNNPMTIPFIQSGQQPIQAQTPLFPTTPLLGATNFSSQLNPFSQGHLQPHYPHSNFPSLHHHTPQFQPNQQMLLNQHPHQQQIIQGSLSHDRVINSGQSGVFNSVMGQSDISTNTGLPDFNGQPKPLSHNNIMHGMNGSAFMLPHNLNILMKPPMFATNSQYNSFATTPIQSNLLSLKSGFEHNSNMKPLDLDQYKHDNSMNDRNVYCGDNIGLQKSNDDYYQEVSEYDNCDMNYDTNWMPNLRYSKVDIYTANSLMPTFDFHSQKSPMQFSPMEPGADTAYRNYITPFRDNHNSIATGLQTNANLQYIISPRMKQTFSQDQPSLMGRQHSKCYDNQNYILTNSFISKNESNESNKIAVKNTSTCGANSASETKENISKDLSNIEKSLTDNKKNPKQRTSYSDNFDDKNQSWSLVEDDRSGAPLEDNRSTLKSNNTETNSHSPNKHFANSRTANTFDNQCQYGYDETQLSSQTAESLGKYDQDQLKKVIMKLREGPVMTDTNCNEFDFTSYKGATIPRLMPVQSSRNKQNNKSFNSYNNSSFSSDNYPNDNVMLGFYSRNRALTPPAAQFRTYRNKTNRNQNSIILSNNSNNSSTSSTTANNTNNNANHLSTINRVSRQKCDTNEKDVDSADLKLSVQSKSLECDNLVLENIIDNPVL